jgi:hypothetical protein
VAPTATTSQPNTIDVTGLPEKAVEAVRTIVEALRQQAAPLGRPAFSSRDEWIKAIREWADSHKPQATAANWDRESIYAGRGE